MAEQPKRTATQQTAAAKAAAKQEAKLRVEIGKQPTTVDEWTFARTKMPQLFTFTDDGNLYSPPFAAGDTEKTIYLAPEEHTTVDELDTYFKTRAAELKEPEEVYASAKRRLREVIEAYKNGNQTVHDVVEANNNVHEAESILNTKAKGARHVEKYIGVIERDLTLNIYDTRKFPVRTSVVEYSIFPWRAFWKKASAATGAGTVPVVAEAQVPGPGPVVVGPARDPEAARTGAIIARRRAAKSGQA